jgi:hypothetical protein
LAEHLKAQLRGQLTIDCYPSAWVMDHIKPISGFDLSSKSGQLAAFHYTNIQPLNQVENQRKYWDHDVALTGRKRKAA